MHEAVVVHLVCQASIVSGTDEDAAQVENEGRDGIVVGVKGNLVVGDEGDVLVASRSVPDMLPGIGEPERKFLERIGVDAGYCRKPSKNYDAGTKME